jgi:hypothetical protein
MSRWLAAGTVVVIALLALLWLQIRTPSAAPVVSARKAESVAQPSRVAATATAPAAPASTLAAQAGPQKLDPASDAFFYKFDEQAPQVITAEAAKCYTGGLRRVHRNAKVKLGYTITIEDGVVAVTNVHVVESTVNDKALEECFAREVAKVTWRDDELPDWKQDDELVIRPERGMKKFTAENRAYEGDGPIGRLDDAVEAAGSRELPR